MASFKTYGHTFEVPDRYSEGTPLSAKEAVALNRLMAEMISHKVRAKLNLSRGETPSDEQVAEANEFITKEAAEYEFGAGRGTGTAAPRAPRDPVEAEALRMAREGVKKAIAKAGKVLGKKGEESEDENVYSFDAYVEKVKQVAADPKTVAQAKKIVKAREASGDDDGIAL
jgi:hypothetical protein